MKETLTLLERCQSEAREIIARALLDGQNQIHDLRSGEATPEEITTRMERAMEYHGDKSDTLIANTLKQAAGEYQKQIRCTQDIDGTVCDCCQRNWDNIEDLCL